MASKAASKVEAKGRKKVSAQKMPLTAIATMKPPVPVKPTEAHEKVVTTTLQMKPTETPAEEVLTTLQMGPIETPAEEVLTKLQKEPTDTPEEVDHKQLP